MPIYTYRCVACGTEREELQPMGASAPGPCAACGGELRRTYGRVGVRFGGWGFASTDGLVSDARPKKDFRELRSRAERIADEP